MRLCCTSPKALRRSVRDTTRLLSFLFPSAIKWVRSSVCSLTPSIFGQKPFWIFFVYEVIIRQKAIYPVLQNRSEYLAPHGLQRYRSEISRIGCFSLFVN